METTHTTPPSHHNLALAVIGLALEKKAVKPLILDLRKTQAFAEMFVIISGNNPRQIGALAEEIRVLLKHAAHMQPLSIDGLNHCNWVLMDYGSFFIHVFQDTVREYYTLEELWSEAQSLPVDPDQATAALAQIRP